MLSVSFLLQTNYLLFVVTAKLSEVKKRLIEDDLFIRHLRQQELMVRRMEKISRRIGKSIEKQIIVLDLKDLSFSLDMTLMKVFRRNLSVDEAFYPERLKVCFLINAPFTFTATWAMIKPWLDPVTAEKTQILGADYKSKLLEYIDEDQIPVEYGGTRQNFAWAWPLNYEE